ncbi:MAG TPA: L-aspartate oxidase [Vicinamibacterales bacterium]
MSSSPAFIIIGSGIAALRAAIELAEAGDVLVLTKAATAEGNTGHAQGGIAAAVGDDDSPERHLQDTLAAGDGLCDVEAVRMLVESGPEDVRQLMEWGAAFDREPDGRLALAREAAHSVRRVLHARDTTGRTIGGTLWRKASALPRIDLREHARALALCVENGRCTGVRYVDDTGRVLEAFAPGGVLLATGGAGQVFRETTNPEVASGDGIAMAYLAGARVADLEFVQFHPTALQVEGQPRFLLSEALRGEGARLVNADGEPFMARYDPAGDLAPRDRVARAIVRELARTGKPVYLSLRHLDAAMVHARFPHISAACRAAGLDLARDPVPVSPAAHYVMGGVETDLDGRTSLPGLYAAGEVACTGVHGANRLASNSLLEGLVFGRRAARAMRSAGEGWPAVFRSELVLEPGPGWIDPETLEAPSEQAVRTRMWERVGLLRDREGLEAAVEACNRDFQWLRAQGPPTSLDGARLASLIIVGGLMARAALRREESRGGHYRSDFPARNDAAWRRRLAEVRVMEPGNAGSKTERQLR